MISWVRRKPWVSTRRKRCSSEARALDAPGVRFVHGDIAEWAPDQPVDVVFSNAALQWLPDHPQLFKRLTTMLVPGGELAVQVPANFDHVSHVLASDIAQEEPFAGALDGYKRTFSVLAPEEYATLLHNLGFAAQSGAPAGLRPCARVRQLGRGMGEGHAAHGLRETVAGSAVSRNSLPAIATVCTKRSVTSARTSIRSSAFCCGVASRN